MCWLYVGVWCEPVNLETLLYCKVLCFLRVRGGTAFKVKISSSNISHILEYGATNCYFIDVWRSKSEIHSGERAVEELRVLVYLYAIIQFRVELVGLVVEGRVWLQRCRRE